MTIKEFCQKYDRLEANVRGKIQRNRSLLKEHITKTPYSKTVSLDEFAVSFLLEDRRNRNSVKKLNEKPVATAAKKPVEDPAPKNTDSESYEYQAYHFWSDEKAAKVMELCFQKVHDDYRTLEYIPDGFKTYELCKCAVQNHGIALKYVPEQYVTDELCRIAADNDCIALMFVPEKYITYNMVKSAFEKYAEKNSKAIENKSMLGGDMTDNIRQLLSFVPVEMRSRYICTKALRGSPCNIEFIPLSVFSDEIIEEALKTKTGIGYLPDVFFDRDNVIAAALKTRTGRERIPLEYWTKDRIIETINKYGFDGIPREAFDYKFYMKLIDAACLKPEQIYESEYYSKGLSQEEWNSLREIAVKKARRYDELYQLILDDPKNIRLMSPDDEKYDLYALIAAASGGDAMKHIPMNKRTYEMCREAVYRDADALMYVPEEFRDKIINEIKNRRDVLRYIFNGEYFSDLFLK